MTALSIIVILLILFALGVLGVIIEGLLWLGLAALVVFAVGAAYGYVRLKRVGT
jgi:hypothetical protein